MGALDNVEESPSPNALVQQYLEKIRVRKKPQKKND